MEGQQGSWRELSRFTSIQMSLKAAIELDVLNILANAGPEAQLSASEIVSKIPTTNPDASTNLERILNLLAVNSLLSTSVRPSSSMSKETGVMQKQERVYGLTEDTRLLVINSGSVPAVLVLFMSTTEILEAMQCLKNSVLESGVVPFEKAFGMNIFEYLSTNPSSSLNKHFQDMLSDVENTIFKDVVKKYQGFQELEELMDVGGNNGSSLETIISIHPHIRGINFDLPHVIQDLPKRSGIKHVAGNMFESLPCVKTILLKFILHDWDDNHCSKILKKCFDALPNNGKVIVMDTIGLPDLDNMMDKDLTHRDFELMIICSGKKRTVVELDAVAKAAGFAETKCFPMGEKICVIEFHKRIMVMDE